MPIDRVNGRHKNPLRNKKTLNTFLVESIGIDKSRGYVSEESLDGFMGEQTDETNPPNRKPFKSLTGSKSP